MEQYINANPLLLGSGALIFFVTVQMILLSVGKRLRLQGKLEPFLNLLKILGISSFIIGTVLLVLVFLIL